MFWAMFLISLRLTAAASAIDAAIHKKMFSSGFATSKTSNEEMNDIIKNSWVSWRIWVINKK